MARKAPFRIVWKLGNETAENLENLLKLESLSDEHTRNIEALSERLTQAHVKLAISHLNKQDLTYEQKENLMMEWKEDLLLQPI